MDKEILVYQIKAAPPIDGDFDNLLLVLNQGLAAVASAKPALEVDYYGIAQALLHEGADKFVAAAGKAKRYGGASERFGWGYEQADPDWREFECECRGLELAVRRLAAALNAGGWQAEQAAPEYPALAARARQALESVKGLSDSRGRTPVWVDTSVARVVQLHDAETL